MYQPFDDDVSTRRPVTIRWGWQEVVALLLGLLGVVAVYYTLAPITIPVVAHLQ
jgi:hypothetical protein